MRSQLTVPIGILILIVLSGGFVYSNLEGWSYFDSVYFTVVTITTIGYGDFSPETNLGKLFTMVFVFLGIAMAFYIFSIVGRSIFKRQLKKELARNEKARQVRKKIRT